MLASLGRGWGRGVPGGVPGLLIPWRTARTKSQSQDASHARRMAGGVGGKCYQK